MKNSIIIMAIASTVSLSIYSSVPQEKYHSCNEGFLPKNNHYIPITLKPRTGGVTQSEFNDVIDQIEAIYGPLIHNYGGTLNVERLWADGTVNASASRMGNTYNIKMYGGLARHETITKDAFALVACHEVGHHIGGVPRYSGQGNSWAAVEGQSDYFATSKCLRRLFENEDNANIVSRMNIDPLVVQKCESQFQTENDIALCKRLSMAGLSSASLFAAMNNRAHPKFETPDPAVVTATFESHPDYQCRLDTYFQGAICEVDHNTEIGQRDPNNGTCNRRDNHQEGLRPKCWFKPLISGNPNPTPGPNPTPNPPPNPNPPIGNKAPIPTVNGQTTVAITNPLLNLPMQFDVSHFPGAVGMAIELSKPNQEFSNPNGTTPDRRNGLGTKVFRRVSGQYNFIPQRELPGYGTYQIRVIGLDQNKRPVSRFSDSFRLFLSNQ
jgi:hypothetical protein